MSILPAAPKIGVYSAGDGRGTQASRRAPDINRRVRVESRGLVLDNPKHATALLSLRQGMKLEGITINRPRWPSARSLVRMVQTAAGHNLDFLLT
jgi:hypothetical protein